MSRDYQGLAVFAQCPNSDLKCIMFEDEYEAIEEDSLLTFITMSLSSQTAFVGLAKAMRIQDCCFQGQGYRLCLFEYTKNGSSWIKTPDKRLVFENVVNSSGDCLYLDSKDPFHFETTSMLVGKKAVQFARQWSNIFPVSDETLVLCVGRISFAKYEE